MEKYYSIGEIGKLLGLTSDAIRFYEKKGLVHPSVNPENRYRMYTFKNVLELLDIIYYRNLEFPVEEIYHLSCSNDPQDVISMMEKKALETQKKIAYEMRLLDKLKHVQNMYNEIERHENVCSIQDFPESMVLFSGKRREDFFIRDIQNMTKDEFVLCAFYLKYENYDLDSTFVAIDSHILSNSSLDRIASCPCVHLSVRMENGSVKKSDFDRMYLYGKENGLRLSSTCLVREIPLTFYSDDQNYFAEIFIPIV